MLHGFTGSPKSVKPWAQVLADQGWRVRVPRLPGHGTRWQDMNITTWHDWFAEADRQYRELSAACEHVFVTGLSMGGSLTLRLAEEHGSNISGVVLVNPAVHTERLDRFLLPVIKHVLGSFPGISNDIAKPGQDEGGYSRIPLKAAASMQEMWKVIRADIAKVTQPLLLFRSAVDNVVESSNADWIAGNVSSVDCTQIVLDRSYHVATLDHDAEIIEQGTVKFIQRITSA